MFIAPILRLVCSMLLSMVLSTFATVTTWQHLVSSPLMVQSPPGISPSAEHFRSPTLLPLSRLATVKPSRPVNCLRRCDRFPKLTQTSQKARLVFILLSTHPSLPLHTPRRAKQLVWCSFCSPHTTRCSDYLSTHPSLLALHLHNRHRSPYISTHPDEPKRLVWCSFCFPHTPRRSAYLSTHPDEPKRLVWCPFCFPHSQIGQHGLSGIVIARLTSPHTRQASLARLVFFLLSTQPSSLALPLHTPRRPQEAHL
jgi:hypothetical protein